LSVRIGRLNLKNPVITASGTFGYGEEYSDIVDIKRLGALVTKTVTLSPRVGNAMPRMAETPSGLLNAIGLQNVGIKAFMEEKVPYLEKMDTLVIASIAGEDAGEFAELARELDGADAISAIEANLSCPNVKGGVVPAQDESAVRKIIKSIKRVYRKPVIAKLSPNVTDITVMAKAAEGAGADAVSLVNTFLGMAIDIDKRVPKIANIRCGLSGPCIRPIAVRMVWDVYNAIKIPIIGMGGIITADDALEFIIAGATAIAVGTANFVNPRASIEILDGIEQYLKKNKIDDIRELIGSLKT